MIYSIFPSKGGLQGCPEWGGSQFIPYIFFYGFLFSMTSRLQIMKKVTCDYFHRPSP